MIGGADGYVSRLISFITTLRGAVWLMLVAIAVFLVAKPDDGEVTVHTQFLLVCFACLAMAPEFRQEAPSS